jgi:ribokinase
VNFKTTIDMNKVIIAGSMNMDIVSSVHVHPKVGETVFGDDLKYFYWWKWANQAVAAARLGAETMMVGMVGDDEFGKKLITFLENEGIQNKISTHSAAHTGTALIAVSTQTSDNTIIVLPGANFQLSEDDVADIEMNIWDVLVCQFEIPLDTIISFFTKGKAVWTINILNPAPAKQIPKELLQLVDILIVNETELAFISGMDVNVADNKSISQAAQKISYGNQSLIVTLGDQWIISFINGEINRIPSRRVEAVDATWAGDCFVGALAARISKGETIHDAIKFANIAASICVTRSWAWPSMPMLDEVMKINP